MFRYTPGAGHYTQVVWAATQAVGCGLVNYGVLMNVSRWILKYFPYAGIWVVQDPNSLQLWCGGKHDRRHHVQGGEGVLRLSSRNFL